MAFDERVAEKLQAHYERAAKRKRSRDDPKQNRLIPESPELDIGV